MQQQPTHPLRTVAQWEAAARGAFNRGAADHIGLRPEPTRPAPPPPRAVAGAHAPQLHQPPHLAAPALRSPGLSAAAAAPLVGAAPFSGSRAAAPAARRSPPSYLFPPAARAGAARASPTPPPPLPPPPPPHAHAAEWHDPLAPAPHPTVSRFLEAAAAQCGARRGGGGGGGSSSSSGGASLLQQPRTSPPPPPPRPRASSPHRVTWGEGTYDHFAYTQRAKPPHDGRRHPHPDAFGSPQPHPGAVTALGLALTPAGRVDPASYAAARLPKAGVLKELQLPTQHATPPVPRGLRGDASLAPALHRLEVPGSQPQPRREGCYRCSPGHAH